MNMGSFVPLAGIKLFSQQAGKTSSQKMNIKKRFPKGEMLYNIEIERGRFSDVQAGVALAMLHRAPRLATISTHACNSHNTTKKINKT